MSKFGESGYVSNIEKYAKQATTRPDDFGYWGSDDMFKTWGFTKIDQNRDSDVLAKSNFKYITEELMDIFPDDYRIENYAHWAVGNVDRLVCRVYDDDDKKIISSSFYLAMEWLDKLDDYPVADEDSYQTMMHIDNIESLDFWADICPGYVDIEKYPDWAGDVLYELEVNMNIEFHLDSGSPKDEDIIQAIYNLQYWNAAGYVKWFEFCDRNNLERPQFLVNDISKNNPNQLEMEF
jgi:hypothetical protein